MSSTLVTLRLSLDDIGKISCILDQHAKGSGLQKDWDALYLSLNNTPHNVLKVEYPGRERRLR